MLLRVSRRASLRCSHTRRRPYCQLGAPIDISPEVRDALQRGSPVVALESTIITHGMPHPTNLDTALSVENKVRSAGSTPATIGVINGRIIVGLQRPQLEVLASRDDSNLIKLSRRDLAAAVALKKSGGTTIAATSLIASLVGIRVFATGGLGGVHRGGENSWDVSADLTELGRTPIAVVSAGVKSILDIGRTLEYLETQGVAVITYGPTSEFPGFYSPRSGHQSSWQVNSPEVAADIINAGQRLGLRTGILFAAPIPEEHAGSAMVIQQAVDKAVKESEENGISKRGKEATPWILRRVTELTQGKSIPSNVALIENTAFIGGRVAVAYAKLQRGEGKASNTPYLLDRPPIVVSSHQNQDIVSESISPSVLPPATLIVIGAAATDVISQPNHSSTMHASLAVRSTSPGKVKFTSGGVARNIAEAAHRIASTSQESGSHRVLLVSPIGNDFAAEVIVRDVQRLGMRIDGFLAMDQSSAVCNMHLDGAGNLTTGVADMSIVEAVDAAPIIDVINKHQPKVVAFDANLSSSTLASLVQFCGQRQIPTFFEPTSVPKSTSILPVLSDIVGNGRSPSSPVTFASPNQFELSHLFNEIRSSSSELTNKLHWWHVMDDFALGEQYRSDLALLSRQSGLSSSNPFTAGIPQMAITLLPFFQHLFIKCGENGVFFAMRFVGGATLSNSWSHEYTRPEQRQLVAKGKDGILVMKHYPAIPIKREEVVNVTGAGDSFAGSVLAAISRDCALDTPEGLDSVMEHAQWAARLSLSTPDAVSSSLGTLGTLGSTVSGRK